MSSMDHRQSGTGEGQIGTRPKQPSDLASPQVPVEQLPFPENPSIPIGSLQSQSNQLYSAPSDEMQPLSGSDPSTGKFNVAFDPSTGKFNVVLDPSTGKTNALLDPATLGTMNRQLQEVDTGNIPTVSKKITSVREPVVIQRTWNKRTESIRPPKGRRLVIHIAVTSLLLVIMMGTLLAVLPVGSDAHSVFNIFRPGFGIVNSKSNNTALIESQAATATAVTQDGYDPGVNSGQYAGVPTPPPSYSGTGNRFFYGQCTYWAAMRYHELTGKWIPWLGNANQWAYGASSSGWIVSSTPKLYSIIVLAGGVQGASAFYGHVAIVEKVNGDGSVVTSNWNWAGNWGATTMVTFRSGPGVSFVYAP